MKYTICRKPNIVLFFFDINVVQVGTSLFSYDPVIILCGNTKFLSPWLVF